MSDFDYELSDEGQTYIQSQINPNYRQYLDDKYKNITNVSQIPNYYIKQSSPNVFIIKCSNLIFLPLSFFLAGSGFLAGLICIKLFCSPENTNIIGLYFGISFISFILIVLIYAILAFPLKEIVYFEDIGFKVVSVIVFFCIHKTKFYKYQEYRSIDIQIQIKQNTITKVNLIYFNENNNKKLLFSHNFTLEEAEYFKYIVMKYIGTKI